MDTEAAGRSGEGATERRLYDVPEQPTVYSLRAFSPSDPLEDGGEFESIAHLAFLVPIYLLPLLFMAAPYGPTLYCLMLPLLLCALNSLPKPITALVHLATVPFFGLLPPSQVAERYLSVEVLAVTLALFLVVGLDKWSDIVACTARSICARYGLRRGPLFLQMCALSFVCALILPDTVVAVTLVYFLDRVFSTIYKEDMDRPLRSSAHASSLQASQSLLLHQDSVTQPSLEQLENEALFDRLSEAVGSLKTGDSKQHTLQGAFKTTSDDDSGASGTTTSTALREGAREVDLQTVTSIPAEAIDNKSANERHIAEDFTEQSRAADAQAGPSTDITIKECSTNHTTPPLREEQSTCIVDDNEDGFNLIKPLSMAKRNGPPKGSIPIQPNTQQPKQRGPLDSPTIMSGGRLDTKLMPYTEVPHCTSMEPQDMRQHSYSPVFCKRNTSQDEHKAHDKPRDTGRSSSLPESEVDLWHKLRILEPLAHRDSSTLSSCRHDEHPNASGDLAVGNTSDGPSDSCERTAVAEEDHAAKLAKSARRKRPGESEERMAQAASTEKVEFVNPTKPADDVNSGSRVHPEETDGLPDRAHLEDLPASVKLSDETGSLSKHPPSNDELWMQRPDSQVTKTAGSLFVREAPVVDTASASPTLLDAPWLKPLPTSKDSPVSGADSDINIRKTRAPISAGVDPPSKSAALGVTSKSRTHSTTLDISTSDNELRQHKLRYDVTRVTTIKSQEECLSDFTTESREVQNKGSNDNDATGACVLRKELDVKVEKKFLVKINEEQNKKLPLRQAATGTKGAQRHAECMLSDSNIEVTQTTGEKKYANVATKSDNEAIDVRTRLSLETGEYSHDKMEEVIDKKGDDKKSPRKAGTKKGGGPSSKKGTRSKRRTTGTPSQASGCLSTDTKKTATSTNAKLEGTDFGGSFAKDYFEAFALVLPPTVGTHHKDSCQDATPHAEKELSIKANEALTSRPEPHVSAKELHDSVCRLREQSTVQIEPPSQLADSVKPEASGVASGTECERETDGTKSAKRKTARKSSTSSSSSSKSRGRNSSKSIKRSRQAKKTSTDSEPNIEKGVSNGDRKSQRRRPKKIKREKRGIVPSNEQQPRADDSKIALVPGPPVVDDGQAVKPLEVKEATTTNFDEGKRVEEDVCEGATVLPVPSVDNALLLENPKSDGVFESAEAFDLFRLLTTEGSSDFVVSGPGQSAGSSLPRTSGILGKHGSVVSGTVVSFGIDTRKTKKDDTINLGQATVALTPSDGAVPKALQRRRPSILKTPGTMMAATRSARRLSSVDFGAAMFTVISPRAGPTELPLPSASAANLRSARDPDYPEERSRFSLLRFVRLRSSAAFQEALSRCTLRMSTTSSQTMLHGHDSRLKRVRKDVHNAFLLGPSLMTTLGGVCNFNAGGHKGALEGVPFTADLPDSPVSAITWIILTLPAALAVAAACSAIIWLVYVKPYEPQPLSSLNERVMKAAEEKRGNQTSMRGAHCACAAYAVIFGFAYAPSLIFGGDPRVALLGALVWLVLATAVVTPILRVTFDFVHSIWQLLPWGVMLLLGATQVASCLLQTYDLANELFKSIPDSFWERRRSPLIQALLAFFTAAMAEIMDKQPLTEVMAPIVHHIAQVNAVYPAYYAIPVIVGASCNVVMPTSVPLALLHEMARMSFWRLLLLGLLIKVVLVSLVIATVNIADKAGFLSPPAPPV